MATKNNTKNSKTTKEDERGRWASYPNFAKNVKVPDANKKAIAEMNKKKGK